MFSYLIVHSFSVEVVCYFLDDILAHHNRLRQYLEEGDKLSEFVSKIWVISGFNCLSEMSCKESGTWLLDVLKYKKRITKSGSISVFGKKISFCFTFAMFTLHVFYTLFAKF